MDLKKAKRNFGFTFMFVPHSRDEVYSFKISDKKFKAFIIVALLMALLIVYLIGHSWYLRKDISELKELRSQNEKQKKQVQSLQKQTNNVKDKIKKLDDLDKQIKDLVGYDKKTDNRQMVSRGDRNSLRNFPQSDNVKDQIKSLELELSQLNTKLDLAEKNLPQLKDKIIAQKAYLAAKPTFFPAEGNITSPFGYRSSPFGRRSEFHNGIDIASAYGSPVRAAGDGVVVSAGWQSGYGREIIIDHGYGLQSGYAHNSAIKVEIGQKVKKGDVIASVGSSGRSTGPHLHFIIWENGVEVDPIRYLIKQG